MTKIQLRLSVVLAIQMLLVVALFGFGYRQQEQHDLQQPLFNFDPARLDRVVIDAGEQSVVLQEGEPGWILPSLHQLPVDDGQLQALLTKLQQLHGGWPVATTATSRKRFEVAADKYQRHLQLFQGEQLVADLYVGTSPGFRKVHVRKAGDDAIYAVSLNSYEMPANANDWLDKTLLAMQHIEGIKGADYVLQATDGAWRFVGGQDETGATLPEADAAKVEQLISALNRFQVQQAVSGVPEGQAVSIEVTGKDGKRSYRFTEANEKYYVWRDDRDAAFEISGQEYKAIARPRRADLAAKPSEPQPKEPETESEESETATP